MQIYKFNSILKPVLWGGGRLVAFKGLPACDEPIGESWELSALPDKESVVAEGPEKGLTLTQLVQRYGADLVGEPVHRLHGDRFPLLIKFIDACRDLSVQVHPDDEMAMREHGCKGKNEMWYILQADEGALIHSGFNRQLSPEEYDRRIGDGSILEVINATPSRPGDVYYIPAGQIHSIGAGNLLVEIQQACDVTYRVFDYNRRDADGNLRQLHTDQARQALDFRAADGKEPPMPAMAKGVTPLVMTPHFCVARLDVKDRLAIDVPGLQSFVALVCVKGEATLQAQGVPQVTLRQGETALVPATMVPATEIKGTAQLLMTWLPTRETPSETSESSESSETSETSEISEKPKNLSILTTDKKPKTMKNKKKWIIGIIAAVVLAMLACAVPYLMMGAPAEGVVKVRKGSSIEQIGDSVKAAVGEAYGKRVETMLRLMRARVEHRDGAYRITPGTSPFTAARRIKNGVQSGVRFTFNNVRTLDEWTERWGNTFMDGPEEMGKVLKDSAVCAKYGKTPQTIACLLMPDTYEFYWNISPERMLDRMFDYYNDFWNDERKAKAQRLGLTPDEVATVASIVEEETTKADERGKVARLYMNRYQQGMRLQADPTVKFALGDFSIKRITVPMTQVNSPYNTYRVNGLPPGPIRLPEKSTIDAVLDAPQHDYLYMCARADFSGYHDFTRGYAEHLDNAHRYQAALNARGIK